MSSFAPLELELGDALRLSDDELFELCARNKDLRIERTAEGNLIIMSPAGFKTSSRNAWVTAALKMWAVQDGSGEALDSSGGFLLPNGAMWSPDAAWIQRARLEAVPEEQQEEFLPLVPDFVVELRSPSDQLAKATGKLEEWRDNGARLGWLIDPFEHRVYVYRPGKAVEVLEQPSDVAGDPELPGLRLDLQPIWQSV